MNCPIKLLIVCHYHNQKSKLFFQDLLDSWNRFNSNNVQFSFLLVSVIGDDFPDCNVNYEKLVLIDSEEKSYLKRATKTYIETAKHIKENIDCDVWFWYEPDVEIVDDMAWNKILKLWNNNRKIMGFWHQTKFKDTKTINGVAFYSKDYIDFVRPYIKEGVDFDRWMHYENINQSKNSVAIPLNGMYALIFNASNENINKHRQTALIIHHIIGKKKKKKNFIKL